MHMARKNARERLEEQERANEEMERIIERKIENILHEEEQGQLLAAQEWLHSEIDLCNLEIAKLKQQRLEHEIGELAALRAAVAKASGKLDESWIMRMEKAFDHQRCLQAKITWLECKRAGLAVSLKPPM
jgi:hypothetical protein